MSIIGQQAVSNQYSAAHLKAALKAQQAASERREQCELRKAALSEATRCFGFPSEGSLDHTAVVKAAEAFYTFLAGKKRVRIINLKRPRRKK